MSFRATTATLCFLGLAGVLGACGGISSPSKNQTQDFAGTLQVGASNSHPFNTSKTGEFTITITDMSDRTLIIGTALGQMISGGCSPQTGWVQPYSRWNQQALGGPIQKGSYCAIVYDSGTLTAPMNYTLHVSFP
jgi:hypothetical protein